MENIKLTKPLRESETVELKKSLSELKEGLVSIAAILNKHGFGEIWFGISPDGQFRQIAGLFVAIFDRPSFHVETVDTTQTPQNPVKAPQNHMKPQENHKKKLIDLLMAQPDLSMKKLSDLSGLTFYSVRHHLIAMQQSGLIRHVGPDKGGYWEILGGVTNDKADNRNNKI